MPVDLAASLYKQFNKSEMIDIAKEIELKVKANQSVKVITNMILDDINNLGVPDECSDLMNEFLYAGGYIDEEGNLIEEEEEEDEQIKVGVIQEDVEEIDQVPDCYTFADERDPACKRCKLTIECVQARIDNRPECFGQLFDERFEECKVCIEATFCSQEM